jgi:hypothetical protein
MQDMSPQGNLPDSEIPGAPGVERWPEYRHLKRKRRHFSRRKTKKIVRITLIVVVHIIFIAFLIYIWIKFAYSSAKNYPLKGDTVTAVASFEDAPRINSPSSVGSWWTINT